MQVDGHPVLIIRSWDIGPALILAEPGGHVVEPLTLDSVHQVGDNDNTDWWLMIKDLFVGGLLEVCSTVGQRFSNYVPRTTSDTRHFPLWSFKKYRTKILIQMNCVSDYS